MRPPEIMVNNDKHIIIRRRETVEDIFNLYPETI